MASSLLLKRSCRLQCTTLMRLYVAVCNFPYTGLRPAADVRFPELLELGLCSVGLCEVDMDRVLAGSPKLEKLAFVLVSRKLRCVLS